MSEEPGTEMDDRDSEEASLTPSMPPPPAFPPPPGGWEPWSTPTPPAEGPPVRRRGRGLIAAALAGLLLLGGIGIGYGITRGFGGAASTGQAPLTAANPSANQVDRALNVQAVADQVEPAVVDIASSASLDAIKRDLR